MNRGLLRGPHRERLHCLKGDAYKETICQSSAGRGLCEMLETPMKLLSLNTEDGRGKKKKEGNPVPSDDVELTNELSQSCSTL